MDKRAGFPILLSYHLPLSPFISIDVTRTYTVQSFACLHFLAPVVLSFLYFQVDLVEQNVAPKMQVYDRRTENRLSASYGPEEVMKCSNGEEVALGQQIVALFSKQILLFDQKTKGIQSRWHWPSKNGRRRTCIEFATDMWG